MNRGHNRAQVFDDDYDHEVFLTLLRRATDRFGVQVHGYALMKNHFHVQATPPNATAIADSIGEIAQSTRVTTTANTRGSDQSGTGGISPC